MSIGFYQSEDTRECGTMVRLLRLSTPILDKKKERTRVLLGQLTEVRAIVAVQVRIMHVPLRSVNLPGLAVRLLSSFAKIHPATVAMVTIIAVAQPHEIVFALRGVELIVIFRVGLEVVVMLAVQPGFLSPVEALTWTMIALEFGFGVERDLVQSRETRMPLAVTFGNRSPS